MRIKGKRHLGALPFLRGSNKTPLQEQLLPRDTTSSSRAPPRLASARGISGWRLSRPGHPDTPLNREPERLGVLRVLRSITSREWTRRGGESILRLD